MLDPARLVFIDEPATSTNMVRLRGRCPRGERLVASFHVDIGKQSLSSPACATTGLSLPS